MIEWSDDDKVLVFPPSSTREPPRSTCARDQSRVGEEIPEPETREIPEQQVRKTPAQKSTGVPTERATEVPEQQTEVNPEQQAETALERRAEQTSTKEELRPPSQSLGVDSTAAPGGSGRHRRFKKLNRQTKP